MPDGGISPEHQSCFLLIFYNYVYVCLAILCMCTSQVVYHAAIVNVALHYMWPYIWENQPVKREKQKKSMLWCLFRWAKMLPSKFEANPMLCLQVRRSSFSLFPLASSCLNNYFRTYVIIDFLANWLVFINKVTYLISTTSSSIKKSFCLKLQVDWHTQNQLSFVPCLLGKGSTPLFYIGMVEKT